MTNVELNITAYESTECPTCGCVLSIPTDYYSPYIITTWACPQCGLVCELKALANARWTTRRLRLAVSADKYIDQMVFDAQKKLDKLLKKYPDVGLRLISGSRTGIINQNDLMIGEIFANRAMNCGGDDYWKNQIWTDVQDNLAALLISMGEQIEEIEGLIKEKGAANVK